MSQRVCFVKINDIFFPEVLGAMPDEEEATGLVMGMIEEREICENEDSYDVVTSWYEIGEGESDTDCFFTDEELLAMCDDGDYDEFEANILKKGYEVYHVQDDVICVLRSQLDLDDVE